MPRVLARGRRTYLLDAASRPPAAVFVLADARACEIERINQTIGDNPGYVRLQALEALRAISKDPASKLYFMDGSSPMPLPLMHMGESGASTR